jgi:hypothetical protein
VYDPSTLARRSRGYLLILGSSFRLQERTLSWMSAHQRRTYLPPEGLLLNRYFRAIVDNEDVVAEKRSAVENVVARAGAVGSLYE